MPDKDVSLAEFKLPLASRGIAWIGILTINLENTASLGMGQHMDYCQEGTLTHVHGCKDLEWFRNEFRNLFSEVCLVPQSTLAWVNTSGRFPGGSHTYNKVASSVHHGSDILREGDDVCVSCQIDRFLEIEMWPLGPRLKETFKIVRRNFDLCIDELASL